jgi:hypothetical protein
MTAQEILKEIGAGMRLKVPRAAGAPAMLVARYSDFLPQGHYLIREGEPRASIGPLDPAAVSEAIASGALFKMTEDIIGARQGWRDIGIDGSAADVYCMVQ